MCTGVSVLVWLPVAVIDVAGYVTELKVHAVDHGFHVHDERHFVETYSLRQAWEVDLHPEEGCGGPLDLHLSLEVDPRVLLSLRTSSWSFPTRPTPPTSSISRSRSRGPYRRCPTDPTCCVWPSIWPASGASTSRSSRRPSTRSPRP